MPNTFQVQTVISTWYSGTMTHLLAFVRLCWGHCINCCIFLRICTESAGWAWHFLRGGILSSWFCWYGSCCIWIGFPWFWYGFWFWYSLVGPPCTPTESVGRLGRPEIWNSVHLMSDAFVYVLFILPNSVIIPVQKHLTWSFLFSCLFLQQFSLVITWLLQRNCKDKFKFADGKTQ